MALRDRHLAAMVWLCFHMACFGAGSEDLCEFASVQAAADAGWYAKASAKGSAQPTLDLISDAKVGRCALEARGVSGQGQYGGLRLVRRVDLSGCGAGDRVAFWVKQNASSGIMVNFGFEGGQHLYRGTKAQPGKWTYVELDMDPAQWDGKGKQWGVATGVGFYTKGFDSKGEHLCLDGLRIRLASGRTLQGLQQEAVADPDRWVFPHETASHWLLGNGQVAFAVSKRTGRVEGGWNVRERSRCLDRLEAEYAVESKASASEATGAHDRVERVLVATPTRVAVQCRNPALAQLRIDKQYDLTADDNKLVRTVTLTHEGAGGDVYATVSSRVWLRRTFRDAGYYMGAGYVGPLVPAPDIADRQRVSRYRISPKGMLLVNRRAGYTLAHYRYRVNGHFLFPWLAKYVETANALYYTPTGWQMGLHTVALRPGRPASIEEHVMILPGTQDDFLARAYPKLPDVAARLKQLQPRPKWREDIKVYAGMGCDEHTLPRTQELVELTDGGHVLILMNLMGPWHDYPSRGPMFGPWGGKITGEYIGELVAKLHALSPRVKVGVYTWLTSATWASRPYKQHPDWYKPLNKDGNFVNLFPGVAANYATHFEKKPCRDYLLKQYADHFRDWDVDCIYLDGSKTMNLIDWQQNTITRDADGEDFWVEMRRVCREAGPDKALFFNGRASLYADISFIEARSEMREANWRDYAGLMACTKSFVSNDPGFVIIPLYWISRLSRTYVNHFLPLGFTPAIGHGSLEALKKLPFITAAYELRPVQQVDVGIQPNWQADPRAKLESYTMRKGQEIILGLIGHYDKATTETVSVDGGKCGFDPKRPVSVWEFDLADPETFQGRAPEAEVKRVYGQTGWFLDRTTAVKGRSALIAKDGRLSCTVALRGRTLKVLALTQARAVVWSVDGLPCHFNLPATRGVQIARRDEHSVEVTCTREHCEVALSVWDSGGARRVQVDGADAEHETVMLGAAWLAKVRVPRGAHTVRWRSKGPSSLATQIALDCPSKVEPGQRLRVGVRGNGPVVLTGLLDGRPVFWDRLAAGEREMGVLVPPAARKGTLVLQAFAGVGEAQASVDLLDKPYSPRLKATLPRTQPPNRKVWDVNKTVRGVKVLRAATSTYHSSLGSPPVAKCDPEKLWFEVGTDNWYTSFLSHSFAGIEAEGLRVVTLDVGNTFYREFSLRATRYHLHPYKRSSRPFAGVMVDYHTPKGYTKRVALSLGLLDMKRSTAQPDWGANRKPGQFVELRKMIDETDRATITIDLSLYAPDGWDGRVWFTPGVDWVAPNRRLIITILSSDAQASGNVTVGTDLAALRASFSKPRVVQVPKATFVPDIDGVMDEETWREAALIQDFVLLGHVGLPRAWTRARLFYDDRNLYFGIQCQEPDRTAPLVGRPNIWRDDEIELWFDVDRDPKTTHQIIVNARGDSLGLLPLGRWQHGAKTAGRAQKGMWTVEAAVPFESLRVRPKPGDKWHFNIARHRPASAKANGELITWAALKSSFRDAADFGTLVFRGTVAK